MRRQTNEQPHYTMKQFAELSGLTARQIRRGITDRIISAPHGRTRNAWYSLHHVRQGLAVLNKQVNEGQSFKAIGKSMPSTGSDFPISTDQSALCHRYSLGNGIVLLVDDAVKSQKILRFVVKARMMISSPAGT